MQRRSLLVASTSLTTGLVGCLDETDRDDTDGSRNPLDLRLYNYTDDTVSIALDANADGESIVSDTFELDAPETVFTDEVVATVPEGTSTVTLDATAEIDGRQETETKSFDLPWEEPIEGFEVRVSSDGGLRIGVMPYEEPAAP